MTWLDENGRDAYLMGFAKHPRMFYRGYGGDPGKATPQEIERCYWWLVGGFMNASASGKFVGWPKISRLNRDICITEKIDGTNGAIGITDDGRVYAQGRNRVLTPIKDDNFGFARWVEMHADALREHFGPGLHFGEWWGVGINRGYGLSERRFSLFNVKRWHRDPLGAAALDALRALGVAVYSVPVLYEGPWTGVLGHQGPDGQWLQQPQQWPEFDVDGQPNPRPHFAPNFIIEHLKRVGSQAAEGFMQPQGIVVYHKAGDICFKVTVERDAEHKGPQA